jgi:hypothetical protein
MGCGAESIAVAVDNVDLGAMKELITSRDGPGADVVTMDLDIVHGVLGLGEWRLGGIVA